MGTVCLGRPIYQKFKRVSDKNYLAFLRKQNCIVCGKPNTEGDPTQAAHYGPRAYGTRSSDTDALPLCFGCHNNGKKAHHELGKHWAQHHRLNVPAIQADLQARYCVEQYRPTARH